MWNQSIEWSLEDVAKLLEGVCRLMFSVSGEDAVVALSSRRWSVEEQQHKKSIINNDNNSSSDVDDDKSNSRRENIFQQTSCSQEQRSTKSEGSADKSSSRDLGYATTDYIPFVDSSATAATTVQNITNVVFFIVHLLCFGFKIYEIESFLVSFPC